MDYVRRLEMENSNLRTVLRDCWLELNIIRARDGVPYTRECLKSDVDPIYFSKLVDRAAKMLINPE